MDSHEGAPPAKRFRYQSHKSTLKEVHLPSDLQQSRFDEELGDNDSHFREALLHWRELNLSPAFLDFANAAQRLCASMPLLLHNWKAIMDLWLEGMQRADDEAIKALLDLMQKLAHDLRTTLAPGYPDILRCLLQVLSRTLSAQTLTTLLASFSAIFKYILIPTVQPELVDQAWGAFRLTLPKCAAEVQRATAEVWGSSLRRLKSASRERCVQLIVASCEGDLADFCAWALVYACKSVSQSIHTATTSLLLPLVRCFLEAKTPEPIYTLLRRVLTALIHHCKGAEQFQPIADLLVEELKRNLDSDEESLRRLLEVIAVVCSVRQGSRMRARHLATLLEQFPSLPLSDALHASLVKFTVSALTAGDMAIWTGPGRNVLERAWARPLLLIELCGTLSDLSWGGWKLLAPQHVSRATRDLLKTHPKEMLELLAILSRDNRLSDVDIVFKERLQSWVTEQFEEWHATEDNMVLLQDTLALSPLLPSLSHILVKIVEDTLGSPDPRVEYENTYANSACLLGMCLECLSRRPYSEWGSKVDITTWVKQIVKKWWWSSSALGGVTALVEAQKAGHGDTVAVDELYPLLRASLLSHSRSLRLNVLHLLSSPVIRSPSGVSDVLIQSSKAEEVSLDLHGVRERIVKIGKLPLIVHDGDETSADMCARWLSAQLKVNLRPLWKPATEALSMLADRFENVVWSVLNEELQHAASSADGHVAPSWMKEGIDQTEDIWEEERTWRDPSAHKLRVVLIRWGSDNSGRRNLIMAQSDDDRFDPVSYETQLLATLAECASLAEKHNRDIIPLFLSLVNADASSKLPRYKLSAWLALFSKFSNPKALYETESLHALFTELLSHPDRSLQRLALSCLLTYKSPALVRQEETFDALLDDKRFRDSLTRLQIAELEPDTREEVVTVLIRLLYGMMLEKRGRARGINRRAAILSALAGCTDEELHVLVDLMLRPLHKTSKSAIPEPFVIHHLPHQISEKVQVGYLNLLGDVIRHLGSRLLSTWPVLLETLVQLLAQAQARLTSAQQEALDEHDAPEDIEEDAEDEEGTNDVHSGALSTRDTRTVRQLALKRLIDFFRCPVDFNFDPYMPQLFSSFVSPRLVLLDVENTQAPSGLLELFYNWSLRFEHIRYLVDFDDRTIPKLYACLVATNVKPAVLSKIFDIVDRILACSAEDTDIAAAALQPHVSLLLANVALLIERNKDAGAAADIVGRRQISILTQIAPYLTSTEQASKLLSLFIPALRKRTVPEKVKSDMVDIMRSLFPLIPELAGASSSILIQTHGALSYLFQGLRSRQGRIALVATFGSLSQLNTSFSTVADLLASLNAFSTKRIQEPDFDRRLSAFTQLNETLHTEFRCQDWLPILHNMLNFIQDPEELTIRVNAAYSLKRFVDAVARTRDNDMETTFLKVLYPGVKNGLHTKSDSVRAELLGVLSHAVSVCDWIESLAEMRVLLAGGDVEANFFNNVHHVQVHRRIRAIKRLADYTSAGHFRSATLADIFIPLVSNFISGVGVEQGLINEAIIAVGRMSRHLSWGSYHRLAQNFLKAAKQKGPSERASVRALVAVLDSFHFPMDAVAEVDQPEAEALEEGGGVEDILLSEGILPAQNPTQVSRIQDAVTMRLLPSLLSYLEKRDEAEDSLRIPISIGIVRVAMHLPDGQREAQISKLLTVLCQALRSNSQDTRDLTRDTICRIATILGPSYLPRILKELRAALIRGPHLHVLAFVVHALLAHITTRDDSSFEKLDDAVADAAHVASEVIFGESGKDVQSEDFKTRMREVRSSSSKGLDIFALLAKHMSPPKISALLLPIRNVMKETETLKVLQQIDDLLKRIASGLNSNPHLVPAELLVLCHTLISQNARFLKESSRPAKQQKSKKDDRMVQTKRKLESENNHYANNSFRFITFGLDLFVTAHRRGRFDFKDANVMARLDPMASIIGNTLFSTNIEVVNLGMKAAAAIVKCPLKSVEKSILVFIDRIVDILKQAGTTESDAAQTALKSLATILRDRQSAQVKEKDLVYLLELTSPDLEEPSRQASVFALLRAIVSRKFVVPEIYDMMDKVVEIMVTSQSPQVQELCRGVLLQFLLDYPQGKGRLKNQMTLLAKNLSYVHESGRKSVMELLTAVVSKFDEKIIHEYADLLFISLVMVIANDDSAKCREMAAELVKALFSRLADPQRNVVMSHLHSWATQHSRPQLARVSLQIRGLLIDLLGEDIRPYVPSTVDDLNASLKHSAEALEGLTTDAEDVDNTEQVPQWQTAYHALTVWSKLLRICTDQTQMPDWQSVIAHLLFPHSWVRTAASRLVGTLFSATPAAAPDAAAGAKSPLSLYSMRETAHNLCMQLRSEKLDAALTLQVVKNLFYIGKCFSLMETPTHEKQRDEDPSGPEQDDADSDSEEEGEGKRPLSWLFSRLSFQARRAYTARQNKTRVLDNWSQQPTAVLKWFAAMVTYMEMDNVKNFLVHILSPVYRIAEDDTVQDEQMDELKIIAIELRDLVQEKVGTTEFANVYSRVRQNIANVRRERKTARVLQESINPQAAAKRKTKRNVIKKDSRKRKHDSYAESKGRIKRKRET